jgi:hypothetical protein
MSGLELGDNLNPPQVRKMADDAADLIFRPPATIVDGDGERPLGDAERKKLAEAFLEGVVLRLSQWWRDGEQSKVAEVVNPMNEEVLRTVVIRAIATLGELGYTRMRQPDVSPGADPSLN